MNRTASWLLLIGSVAAGRVINAEQQLEDSLRLGWAAAKRNGR